MFQNQKTETVNREPKTEVLKGFDIAKKRGFGAGFDNHNNTNVKCDPYFSKKMKWGRSEMQKK